MFIARRAKQGEGGWGVRWGGEDGGSKVKWKGGGTSSKVPSSREGIFLKRKLLIKMPYLHSNQSRKTILHDSSVMLSVHTATLVSPLAVLKNVSLENSFWGATWRFILDVTICVRCKGYFKRALSFVFVERGCPNQNDIMLLGAPVKRCRHGSSTKTLFSFFFPMVVNLSFFSP